MLSDHDIAILCSDIYSQPSTFDKIIEIAKIYLGVKEYDDCVAIVARGSYTLLDWIRDLEAIALIATTDIGLVPFGFYNGIPAALTSINLLGITKPIVMGGHSLGAAHIAQLGGIMLAKGLKLFKTRLMGCPTPGGEKLRYIWSGSDIVSYRNLSDPVTMVPVLPSLRPVCDFTLVSEEPSKPDPWGVFSDHHIQYYCAGISKLLGVQNGKSAS